MNWYFDTLKKYFVFAGNATREEFWMFSGFNAMIISSLKYIEHQTGIGTIELIPKDINLGLLSLIFAIIIAFPSLSVSVRRLQDCGHNGRFVLVAMIPVVGWIWLAVLLSHGSKNKI